MLNIIVKIIGALLCGFVIVYTTNSILNEEDEYNKLRIFIAILLISGITYISYNENYKVEYNLGRIIFCILIFKIIFNKSAYKTINAGIISMALLSICDLIGTLVFIRFITIEEMRGTWYWIIICNSIVAIIDIIIIKIPFFRNKLRNFIKNLKDTETKSIITILIISLVVVIYLFYNISVNYEWSPKYYINIIIALAYIIIIFITFKDKIEYNNLMREYDTVFEYFKELEESIDKVSLINHEYKNQIAVLKGYIEKNDKKAAIKYINNIIEDLNLDNSLINSQIKNIPKGGIKGLLYYKIITSNNKNITITIDASDKVTKNLKKLTYEQNKYISKIIGVYIDNAIEETQRSNKNNLNVEIYEIENSINFVISNPISKSNNINLSNIGRKNYTTKGIGHGKGLYLINKLIRKIDYIESETKIINNYYIQKLIIKNK